MYYRWADLQKLCMLLKLSPIRTKEQHIFCTWQPEKGNLSVHWRMTQARWYQYVLKIKEPAQEVWTMEAQTVVVHVFQWFILKEVGSLMYLQVYCSCTATSQIEPKRKLECTGSSSPFAWMQLQRSWLWTRISVRRCDWADALPRVSCSHGLCQWSPQGIWPQDRTLWHCTPVPAGRQVSHNCQGYRHWWSILCWHLV